MQHDFIWWMWQFEVLFGITIQHRVSFFIVQFSLLSLLKHLFPKSSFSLSVLLSCFAFLLPLQEFLYHFRIRIEFNSFNNNIIFFILNDLFQDFTLESHLIVLKFFFQKLLRIIGIHDILLLITRITTNINQPIMLPSLQSLVLNRYVRQQQLLVVRNIQYLFNSPWWKTKLLVWW